MEASQAGLSGGDAGGQGEGQAQQGLDPGQFQQTLDSLTSGQEELRSFLQSQPWQQQQEEQQPEEPSPMDLSFLDPDAPEFNPEVIGSELERIIGSQVDARTQSLIDQHVKPLQDKLTARERADEALQLVNEFPELEDQQVANEVVQVARSVVDAYGFPAELADSPKFWGLVYQASANAKAAQQEDQAQGSTAHMEYGRGASAPSPEADLGAQIVQSRRSVLPF